MPVVASFSLPKVRINPGSRTFGPFSAPASPLTGLVFTSLRNTSANPKRRGDTASSVYSILFEGRVAATGVWKTLGGFTCKGGAYVLQGDPEIRALQGRTGEELDADRFESNFAEPTLFSNLRAAVTVSGGMFEGECTLELMGA